MEQKVCGITQNMLRDGHDNSGVPFSIKLKCGHWFDTHALQTIINYTNKNICPTCKSPVVMVFK